MRGDVVVVLVAVTSALALLAGRIVFGLSSHGLRQAVIVALEVLGASAAFFALNVAVGMAFAIVMRGGGTFVPLYAMGDVVLLLFSALQGVVFATWRTTGKRP